MDHRSYDLPATGFIFGLPTEKRASAKTSISRLGVVVLEQTCLVNVARALWAEFLLEIDRIGYDPSFESVTTACCATLETSSWLFNKVDGLLRDPYFFYMGLRSASSVSASRYRQARVP